jgi:hypothetical protein
MIAMAGIGSAIAGIGSAIAAIGALLIGGFIASVLRAYGVISTLGAAFRGLRFFLSPGRLLGGIASIGRRLAAFSGVLLAGGLIGRRPVAWQRQWSGWVPCASRSMP